MFSAPSLAPTTRNTKSALSLLAMEARMLFDGAGAATVVNHEPIAVADCRTLQSDQAIVNGCAIGGNNLGDNRDCDPDGDALHVTGLVTGAQDHGTRGNIGTTLNGTYGQLLMQADGSYTYTPYDNLGLAPGQQVTDTFTYLICDDRGGEASTTLSLNIVAAPVNHDPNHNPNGNADSRTLLASETVNDGDVLAGNGLGDVRDTDPDGDALHVTGVVPGANDHGTRGNIGNVLNGAYGQLLMQADGSYTYTPYADLALAPGQRVSEQFTYMICDNRGGEGSAVLALTVVGPTAKPGTDPGTDPGTEPTVNPDKQPPASDAPRASDNPRGTDIPAADTAKTTAPVAPVAAGIYAAPAAPLIDTKLAAFSSIVATKSVIDSFALPVDHFSPFAAERILGVSEEAAPAEKVAAVKDDCIRSEKPDAEKIVVKAKPKAVKPSVFAKPELEVKQNFSEQLKLAKKSFRAPVKVQPVAQPADC